MWLVIPVKDFGRSKQRLAAVLDSEQRRRCCQAMTDDVLSAVTSLSGLDGISLVSSAPEAKGLAQRFGVEYLDETALNASGLNAVLEASISELGRRGQQDVMVLHADLPLVTPAELAQVIDQYKTSPTPAMLIAGDRHGTGTNGLIVPTASKPRLGFGAGSFSKHIEEAARLKLTPLKVVLSGFGRDIDLPEDLDYLINNNEGHRAPVTKAMLKASAGGATITYAEHAVP